MWTRAASTALFAVMLCSLSLPASAGVRPDPRPGCPTCHGDPLIASRYEERLYVPESTLAGTAHAGMGCFCHPSLSSAVHADLTAELEETREACVGCHGDQASAYVAGAHVRRIGSRGDGRTTLAGDTLEGLLQRLEQRRDGRFVQTLHPLGQVVDLHRAGVGDVDLLDLRRPSLLAEAGAVALGAGGEGDRPLHEGADVRLQRVDVLGQHRLLDLRDQALVGQVDVVDLDLVGSL